jgi:SAM-dependent methyltransferase
MNSKKISELYKLRYKEINLAKKNKIWKLICSNFFQRFIPEKNIVLELASGHGEFINNIEASKKISIDINKDVKKYLNSNVFFYETDASQINKYIKYKVDTVFVSNFLEHLKSREDLEAFFKAVKGVLKKNGSFIILGPNLRYQPGKYWDYYDHYLGLTHLSLIEALELNGFQITLCIDKFLPHADKGDKLPHPFLVWLYLKIPLAWKVMGKQFFVVAKPK